MKGKVAVIVGGASGFGYACAKIFAAEGAEIVIAGRRGALATETANEFNGLGVSWDVTDFEQGKRAQEEVMEKYLWLMSEASKNISGKSFDCQQ